MTCASSLPPDPMRFHERAESYDAHAAPQKRFAEALAAFAPFRRGVRVTELGAGTGFLTAALLARSGSYAPDSETPNGPGLRAGRRLTAVRARRHSFAWRGLKRTPVKL